VPGTDMPPANLADMEIWRLAAFVRSLGAPAYESKLPGDADAGAAIFFGKGGCSGCHMVHGRGGFLGPDLTGIGAERTAPRLREAIVKPSARIVEGYEGVSVTTLDGTKISGVARNNDDYSIQILDGQGRLHLLSKDKLSGLEFREKPLMPEDYGQRLSPGEIVDLVAYLGRQSVRPPLESGPDRGRGLRR
jgi:cytochrome c oxidase cbb3-type subunit 3